EAENGKNPQPSFGVQALTPNPSKLRARACATSQSLRAQTSMTGNSSVSSRPSENMKYRRAHPLKPRVGHPPRWDPFRFWSGVALFGSTDKEERIRLGYPCSLAVDFVRARKQ